MRRLSDGWTSASTTFAMSSSPSGSTVSSPVSSSDRRPPRSANAYEGNLPAVAVTLFGRSDDVESIVSHLGHARVVTLTGVGGVGKTRLALEVGRVMQATGFGGVWFAALDTVDRPEAKETRTEV